LPVAAVAGAGVEVADVQRAPQQAPDRLAQLLGRVSGGRRLAPAHVGNDQRYIHDAFPPLPVVKLTRVIRSAASRTASSYSLDSVRALSGQASAHSPQKTQRASFSSQVQPPSSSRRTAIAPLGQARAQSPWPMQRDVSIWTWPRKPGGAGSGASGYPVVTSPVFRLRRKISNIELMAAPRLRGLAAGNRARDARRGGACLHPRRRRHGTTTGACRRRPVMTRWW